MRGADLPMTYVNAEALRDPALEVLAGHPQFAGIGVATLLQELEDSHALELDDGEFIVREGDPAGHWFAIESGGVDMLRYAADGQERLFHQFHAGDLVADMVMFMPHGLYPMNARAHGRVRVHRFTRAAIWRLCESHPPLAMRMLERLAQRLFERVNEIDWLASSSAAQRLAAYLLDLSQRQAAEEVVLPVSQRQLAAMFGIRAETLSRLLSDWTASGHLCRQGKGLRLCDPAWLARVAGPGRGPGAAAGSTAATA